MNSCRALCSSPWIPRTIVSACRCDPVYAFELPCSPARPERSAASEGCCIWPRTFTEQAESGAFNCAVAAVTCDQARRSVEQWSRSSPVPVFHFNVPATAGPPALKLYKSECRRLAAFLCGVSRLEQPDFTAAYHPEAGCDSISPSGGIPLCLLGSHAPFPLHVMSEFLSEAGACIVIDGTESGPRFHHSISLSDSFCSSPLDQAAEETFYGTFDISTRPNSSFYRWLSIEIKKHQPKGVIVARNSWCDLWSVETIRIRNWLKIPVTEIVFTSGTLTQSIINRIDALVEACRQ